LKFSIAYKKKVDEAITHVPQKISRSYPPINEQSRCQLGVRLWIAPS